MTTCEVCGLDLTWKEVATESDGTPVYRWVSDEQGRIHCDYVEDGWPWGNDWNLRLHTPKEVCGRRLNYEEET